MNKKSVKEIFQNLSVAGQLKLIVLISNKTGMVPSVDVFIEAVKSDRFSYEERHSMLRRLAKTKMLRKTLVNLAKSLIWYGATEGLTIATKLRDRNLSSYTLRHVGIDEARQQASEQVLVILYKSADPKAVQTFRKRSVISGELRLALSASSFEKKPLTDKEIKTLLVYNSKLPHLPEVIAVAKHFGIKLQEKYIQPGIEEALADGGNWEDVFNATEAIGRTLSAMEWSKLLEQTRRWANKNRE